MSSKSGPSRETEAHRQVASWAGWVKGSSKIKIQAAAVCVVSVAQALGQPCPAMGEAGESRTIDHPASSRVTIW